MSSSLASVPTAFHCALGVNHDLLATFRDDAASPFLVQNARVRAGRIKVGLVAADHPLVGFLAAILNPGVAADEAEIQVELKVADFAFAPDQKRVVVRGIVGRRLAADDAVLHAPEPWIAVPALERLAVEQDTGSAGSSARTTCGQLSDNKSSQDRERIVS